MEFGESTEAETCRVRAQREMFIARREEALALVVRWQGVAKAQQANIDAADLWLTTNTPHLQSHTDRT